MLPSDSAPPVFGLPPPPAETKESSQKGDHSVSEDIEEESISEWEIERQMEKVRGLLKFCLLQKIDIFFKFKMKGSSGNKQCMLFRLTKKLMLFRL